MRTTQATKTSTLLLALLLRAGMAHAGDFAVLDCGDFKTHVYDSGDAMANTSLIVEGKEGLVAMELPLFKENMAEFTAYIARLNKPLVRVVTDYHAGALPDAPNLMPEGMPAFVKGGRYTGMMAHFKERFGDRIVDLPDITAEEAAFGSTATLAGVSFTFNKGPTTGFPAADILIGGKVYYTHWTPARAHMNPLQLSSPAAVDAELASTRAALDSGAVHFVGGHGGVAKEGAVQFRLDYLETVRRLRGEHETAAAFAEALKAAYPDLPGAEGVEKLAEALYK